MNDVVVIGAGPAGVLAAIRAAELGARTTIVSSGEFGGMAANDGPVPVRALAYAAKLLSDARQLPRYGISAHEPILDYDRLLARVGEIVRDVRGRSALRERIDELGVTLHERCGPARFVDAHTVETAAGPRLAAAKFIICTGGASRRLPVPGFEHASTHSDVWKLKEVPESMLVVGTGSTGVQIASMFRAFGTRISLFERGPRVLPAEDETVATAVADALRASGIEIHERFGEITAFERTATGVRMHFSKNGEHASAEATVAVVAAGWAADTSDLNLAAAGVEVDQRGNIKVDRFLQTSAPHVFAAGDVTGRVLLVPGALEDGFLAATNAVQGLTHPLFHRASPAGSFTHPEYAHVGLSESKAREGHDVVTTIMPFDKTVRAIIEGRTFGFCKLVIERDTGLLLGCHVVGERAVEIAQLAALAIAARMPVDAIARVAISFPTYAEVLVEAAVKGAVALELPLGAQAQHREALGVSA